MQLKNLQDILDARPSVSGNTFLISSLFVVSILLLAAFTVLGVGLLLESFSHYHIFLDWLLQKLRYPMDEELRWKIASLFGLFSLFLAMVFSGVVALCRMILKRNHFIIQIEDWLFRNINIIAKTNCPKIQNEMSKKNRFNRRFLFYAQSLINPV